MLGRNRRGGRSSEGLRCESDIANEHRHPSGTRVQERCLAKATPVSVCTIE